MCNELGLRNCSTLPAPLGRPSKKSAQPLKRVSVGAAEF
jgi:hypothetical protein